MLCFIWELLFWFYILFFSGLWCDIYLHSCLLDRFLLLTKLHMDYVTFVNTLWKITWSTVLVSGYRDTGAETICEDLYFEEHKWCKYIFTAPLLATTITLKDATVIFFTGGRPMTWESTGRVSVPWCPRRPLPLHPPVQTVPSENSILIGPAVYQIIITNIKMLSLHATVQMVPSENCIMMYSWCWWWWWYHHHYNHHHIIIITSSCYHNDLNFHHHPTTHK